MAYDGYESINYDELSAEKAALREAASANENLEDKRDESYGDAADLSADEKMHNAAQWSEGAPACLAAVVFAQRMQRRREAPALDGHDEGASSLPMVEPRHARLDDKIDEHR